MFRKVVYVVVFCCLFSLVLFAETVVLNSTASAGVSFSVVDNSDDYTIIEVDINSYTRETVDIDGERYLQIAMQSSGVTLEAGFPSLPILARSIIIGADSRMEMEVLKARYTEFSGKIAPSKGNLYRDVNPADIPFTFDGVYKTDAFYPSEQVRLTEPYVMRELRGIAVQVLPVSVNPVQETVRVYHQLVIKVYADGKDDHESVLPGPPTRITDSFVNIYKDHFINYDYYDTRYPDITELGSMLVICYPDFMTAMQPLVDWKNQKGLPTTIIPSTNAGADGNAVKTFIANYYENNPTTAFILLVGDSALVPFITYNGGYNNSGPQDPSYAFIVGGANDCYPDLLIGRISAQTIAQVTTQVEKTIHYERDINTDDSWIPNATGIASNGGPGHHGEYDFQHVANIRNILLAYGYETVDAFYETQGATASMVSTAINAGRSYINYTGHGDTQNWVSPNYTNSHVNMLTNNFMLPFIISVACNNGKFNAPQVCFAEAWMNATNSSTGEYTGAVSTFMCSILQAWNPPMDTQDKVVELLTTGQKRSIGALVYNAQSAMLDVNNNNSGKEVMRTWILFGDPSLTIRTKVPEELAVQAPESLPLGVNEYTVDAGEEDALVCLYRADTYEIVDAWYTDEDGLVTLDASSVSMEDCPLLLTITAFDRVAFIQEISRSDPPVLIPYSEDFNSGTELELIGWEGELNNNSGISAGSGVYDTNGLVLNVYGDSPSVSITTPAIAGFGSRTMLTFNYRIVDYTTDWGSSLTAYNLTSDDKVYVEVSTSGRSGEYAVIKEINNTNHTASTQFSTIAYAMADYTNNIINIKFRASRAGGNWDVVIDNFAMGNQLPPPGEVLLLEPVNYALNVSVTPELQWNRPIGIISGYRVYISSTATPYDSNSPQDNLLTVVENIPSDPTHIFYTVTDDQTLDYEALYYWQVVPYNAGGSGVASPIFNFTTGANSDNDDTLAPIYTVLRSNYPNPFNPTTNIAFTLNKDSNVSISVFDIRGRLVVNLVDGFYKSGHHNVVWNGVDNSGNAVASGVYFYRMTSGDYQSVRKMVMLK